MKLLYILIVLLISASTMQARASSHKATSSSLIKTPKLKTPKAVKPKKVKSAVKGVKMPKTSKKIKSL